MDIGDKVYLSRVIPSCNIFEVDELIIRTIESDYYVGYDKDTRQAFLFYQSDIGNTIFHRMFEAKDVVDLARNKYGTVKLTKITEES